ARDVVPGEHAARLVAGDGAHHRFPDTGAAQVARSGAAEVVELAPGHHHLLPLAKLGAGLDARLPARGGPRLANVAHGAAVLVVEHVVAHAPLREARAVPAVEDLQVACAQVERARALFLGEALGEPDHALHEVHPLPPEPHEIAPAPPGY